MHGGCELPWWLGGDYIVDLLLPVYADNITFADVPAEPDTEHLLGSRFADYGIALLFALAIPLLRWGLTVAVYRPMGIYFMGKRVSKDPTRMGKWVESAWKFTVYLSFSTMAFLVSYQHNWFWETRWHWLGCTRFPPCNLEVRGLCVCVRGLCVRVYICVCGRAPAVVTNGRHCCCC
jgi:hypothetical protein